MAPFVKPQQVLEFLVPGAPVTDRFGNTRPSTGEWRAVRVAQWWIDRSEEAQGDSVLRTVDMLHVHVPTGDVPSAASQVRLADGSTWSIEGNAENYEHGFHGWKPGLLVVHAKKVEG